jgi:CYTH domain-containing protein
MPLEIERKYLVNEEKWLSVAKPEGIHYSQGYILNDPQKTVRVRVTDKKCFITIKGATTGATRAEYEYAIPRKDAEELLNNFCAAKVEKMRYSLIFKNKLWEVDEFLGKNEGLIIAEIELKEEDEIFVAPSWMEKEITGDARYYNANLAQNPYQNWKPDTSGVSSGKLPWKILNDISDLMEAGMNCYLHKTTFEVVSVPDENRFPQTDWEDEDRQWKEEMDKVFGNPDYMEIEKMESSDSFEIMEDFAMSLPESATKIRLMTALEGHKPFRNFNHQIHNAEKTEKEQWFRFRRERDIEWIKEQLEGRV